MTTSDQRTEPVFEIDLHDLAAEDEGGALVVVPDLEPAAGRPERSALPDLEHPDPAARLAALAELARRPGPVPVVAVAGRLRDPEPDVRRAAVEILGEKGDERALLLLLDAIEDPVEELRRAAGDALRRRSSPGLIALLRKEQRVPGRAQVAARALADLEEARPEGEPSAAEPPVRPASEDVPALLDRLSDRSPQRRRIACERLGVLRAGSAVEPLLARLADPERGVRIKAADALALIGDQRSLEGLKGVHASEPDEGVAQALGRAIAALSERR